MLVLSRRPNEEVSFPDLGITIEVLQVKGSTVRLGFKAPKDVRILRGELEALHSQWQDLEIEIPVGQVQAMTQFADAS